MGAQFLGYPRAPMSLLCLAASFLLPPVGNKCSICYPIRRYVLRFHPHVQCVSVTSFVVQEDPELWHSIGILYNQYGSLDRAEEPFASVLKMDKG